MDTSLLLWDELTAQQRRDYEKEYIESMVLETGCLESDAALLFDCRFDCVSYDQNVYHQRDIKRGYKP